MKLAEKRPVWVVVTGAGGRIGHALRAIWGGKVSENLPILWFGRAEGDGPCQIWDIGQNPPPVLPEGAIVLHLAGRVRGTPEELAQNAQVTGAVCAVAHAAGAQHVFVMSSVAVYAPGDGALHEGNPPAPVSPYGVAKLAAEQAAVEAFPGGVTMLRLANLAGADALLGAFRPVVLDPVAGQAGGPVRSYIGPRALAQVLEGLIAHVVARRHMPDVVNVAQQPPVAMADLLTARGQPWQFGPPRAGVVARVVVDTARLEGLMELPQTSPAALIADLGSVAGWPG